MMEDGSFTMTIIHEGWLAGTHEVKATYHLIEGDITGNDSKNWPLMEYEITKDGQLMKSGKIRSSFPRSEIYEMFLALCMGIR